MTLGSDSDEVEGCASSPSFYNVSLAILFLVFFFLLVVAKGSALDCGRAIAQPLVYRCFYFCVVVVETTVMFSSEAASSGS